MASNLPSLRAAIEAFNAHDRDRYVAAYRPDVTLHGFPEGVVDAATLGDFFAGLWDALPDARVTLVRALEEGDELAALLTISGTHEGELMGAPASHRSVSFDAMTIVRFDAGKIAERWNVADFLTLLQQVGAVPAAA